MKNVHDISIDGKRLDEASAWISKMDIGLTDADEEALKKWLSADSANREIMLTMASQWDRMNSLSRLADVFPVASVQQPPKPFWGLPQLLAATGSVAVVATLLVTQFTGVGEVTPDLAQVSAQVSEPTSSERIYETAIGEQSSIVLPDGTHLRLNTDSLLTVNYSDHQRLLYLERGEVNVEVAHDPSRPLRVVAKDRFIQAVGTEFNIELTGDQLIELLVTDGTVLVGTLNYQAGAESPAESNFRSEVSVPVSAGEKIVLGTPQEHLVTIAPADIELNLSWREGNLVFRGESLEQVMAEVARYTDIEFVFLDAESRQVRVVGLFKIGDLNALLSGLKQNFNVANERVSGNRILLSAG